MEVASGEYGEQMVRLVKAVQKCDQLEPNGDTNLHPLLWQRAEEVKNKRTTSCTRTQEVSVTPLHRSILTGNTHKYQLNQFTFRD